VRGRQLAPNSFIVRLHPDDVAQFGEIHDALVRELCDAAREHGRDESYAFLGPIEVQLVADDAMRVGQFDVEAHFRAGAGGTGAGSLVLPTGDRYVLDEHPVVLGRHPDCDLTLLDTNVSRRHAEIQPRGDRFVLVDLGSTNGSRVNGVRVTEHELRDGYDLSFGNTHLVFEAS
jgi:pSer/pThr/pTyr-binding forkhead associated (FHA) protein